MGYKINSVWTELRKNDIEKLNAIIDDHYCIENEIGRKLNMMNEITNVFNKEIHDINFDIIVQFMQANDWKWSFYDGGSKERVPTRDEMIRFLRDNFLKRGLYEMIELNKDKFDASSGGFFFDMGRSNDGTYYVQIIFDIAHFIKDDIDE